MSARLLLNACTAAVALCVIATPAAAQVQPYRAGDYGGFRDVLPPGTNGRTNLVELATGTRPQHNDDQRGMYERVLSATPGVTPATLGSLFKDSSFGSPPGGQARAYSPREGLTITRDSAFGVPHVYGSTRAAAMFGLGYAGAEDRLVLMDVLRHTGRAQLSSFAGGAAGNRAQDANQWRTAPYTEADLQRQADQLDDLYGADGQRLQEDAANYVAGVNQYISEAKLDPTKLPGEYAAIGRPLGPDPWKVTDIIATASLVGGIFGKGGGGELTQMELRRSFIERYGARRGRQVWREWAAYEDRDAPTTVRRRFPYQTQPRRPARGGTARSAARRRRRPAAACSRHAGCPTRPSSRRASRRAGARWRSSARRSPTSRPRSSWSRTSTPRASTRAARRSPGSTSTSSSAAARTTRGARHRPARTSSTRSRSTSAGPGAAKPTIDSDHYLFRGRCEAIETLERVNRWQPTVADATPRGATTLRTQRTKLGLVSARATIKGKPVLYTQLRSTYNHEVDSALGFADFNDPSKIRDAAAFQRAAAKIGYTFNWLYADDRDIAYFNSGNNPQRAPGVNGQLPMPGRLAWRGLDPDRWTAAYTSFAKHPQAINGQPYMTSWNNKQAPGYAGADSNLFSSVFRSQMLDQEIEARIAGPATIDLPGLVEAMGEAATTDLRAEAVLPLALDVIGAPADAQLADAVAKLRAWVANGSHRRDRDGDGVYEHADAIRILDAFWPRWMHAQFEPSLGPRLFAQLAAAHELDNAPNNHGDHLGSAYQGGWYGYAAKDLRRVLGRKVAAPYSKRYCGAGSRSRCRAVLRSALADALGDSPAKLYADRTCATAGRAGDQDCFDAIAFRATGGVTQPLIGWQNRPTYQQAIEVEGHRPRP